MKKLENLVSVILPVHNAGEFLHECLESLLAQTYKDIEIIAIDDNSKDESFAILKKFRRQDKRIRIYRNIKRYGLAISLNRAVRRTKGAFITFMDAKDACLKQRIKKQILYLLSHPKVVGAGTQCAYIDGNNKRLAKSSFPEEHSLIQQTLFTGSLQFETVMINRSLLPKDVLHFKAKTYPRTYSEVFIKLLTYGEFANLPESLYFSRQAIGSSSQSLISHINLWFKYLMLNDTRPSIRTLLYPLITRTNTVG